MIGRYSTNINSVIVPEVETTGGKNTCKIKLNARKATSCLIQLTSVDKKPQSNNRHTHIRTYLKLYYKNGYSEK